MNTWGPITGTACLFLQLIFPVYADGPGTGPGGPDAHEGGPGSFVGHMGHELEHNLVLPQIATGRDVSTTLALASQANPERMHWLDEEDLQISGTIFFFHQDGSPMPVRVNGEAAAVQFLFQLEPVQMLILEITGEGPSTPGWALVVVDDVEEEAEWGMRDGHSVYRGERLMATAFYTLTGEQGELISRVGVIPSAYQRDHFFNSVLIAQFGPSVNTGLAVVNTSSDSVSIQAQLMDITGQVVAETQMLLENGNQTALFIDELFPESVPGSFVGYLQVTTEDEGVLVMGLLMSQGILTSVPTHHFGGWQAGNGMMP